jgi:hypothetical protein
MPYPPDKVTTNQFKDYRKLLDAYATDPSLRQEVLSAKALCERFIDNLETHRSYIDAVFHYVSKASVSELNYDLRIYQRTIDDLPDSIHSDPELNKPLVQWKRYLERIQDELKQALKQALEEKGGEVSPAQKRAAEVVSDVKVYLEAVRLLEEQCEIDVKNHPRREKEIRRRYRKAIDALNEGE